MVVVRVLAVPIVDAAAERAQFEARCLRFCQCRVVHIAYCVYSAILFW